MAEEKLFYYPCRHIASKELTNKLIDFGIKISSKDNEFLFFASEYYTKLLDLLADINSSHIDKNYATIVDFDIEKWSEKVQLVFKEMNEDYDKWHK